MGSGLALLYFVVLHHGRASRVRHLAWVEKMEAKKPDLTLALLQGGLRCPDPPYAP